MTNREHLDDVLPIVAKALRPYIEREMEGCYGDRWKERLTARKGLRREGDTPLYDLLVQCDTMWTFWDAVFGKALDYEVKNALGVIRSTRNLWAHLVDLTARDTYRALDAAEVLLCAVKSEDAEKVESHRRSVLRALGEEEFAPDEPVPFGPVADVDLSRRGLERLGFKGFVSVAELKRRGCDEVPAWRGVYVVYREADGQPGFMPRSCGAIFKGNNPSVPVPWLGEQWVEDAHVVYVGKAGDVGSSRTLRTRIDELIRFGSGVEGTAHWGGRLIWQLEDHDSLLVAWTETEGNPLDTERKLVEHFRRKYGLLPFANLRNP